MIFVNPDAGYNINIPNIALGYAAAYYPCRGVIDLNTKLSPQKRYLDFETGLLGISVQSRTLSETLKIKNEYQNKYPKSQIKSITSFIDIQCCYPFLELEENLKYEADFSDELPFPNYELFDSFEIFQKNWQKGTWHYAIMTSLGCPFSCIFCSSRNRKWRPRSPENCYQELKQAQERWHIRSFSILDDCFNFNKERVYEFCRRITPLNLKWSCANGLRADLFNEKTARLLHQSGCRHVSFGVESISPEVLENIKKGEKIEQIETAVKIAQKAGLNTAGFFILALPGSSYDSDLSGLFWALRKNITPHFSFYIPETEKQDSLFCGDNAKPRSTVYSPALQEKVYNLTASFKTQKRTAFNFPKIIITRLYIAIRYDTQYLPVHIISLLKHILDKFIRKV